MLVFLSSKPLSDITGLVVELCEKIEMCVQCMDDAQIHMLTTGHSSKAE